MKKVILMLLVSYAAITNTSCKKTADLQAPQLEELSVSKTTTLKKKEPVKITLNSVSSGSTVKWTVNPPTNVLIRKNGNSADFQFLAKGTYTITANYGSINTSREINVGDTTNTDTTGNGGGWNPTDTVTGGVDTTLFTNSLLMGNDTIVITPVLRTHGSELWLDFDYETEGNYYCNNSGLGGTITPAGLPNELDMSNLQITNVVSHINCQQSQSVAKGSAAMNYLSPNFQVGQSRTFAIGVEGNTDKYYGTITKTNSGYQISLTYPITGNHLVKFTKLDF
jgi:hypothetical protein